MAQYGQWVAVDWVVGDAPRSEGLATCVGAGPIWPSYSATATTHTDRGSNRCGPTVGAQPPYGSLALRRCVDEATIDRSVVPSNSFSVEERPSRERVVIAVRGEIDMVTAPNVSEMIAGAVANGWDDVVVDLRGVSFMDSSGVHLLETLREMRSTGVRCSMIDGAPPVSRVLEITGLSDVLPRVDPAEL